MILVRQIQRSFQLLQSADNWWLRSAYSDNDNNVGNVNNDGNVNNNNANNNYGLASD